MPWAEQMHEIPWHVDLWRAGHRGRPAATAVNKHGGTYFTITRAQVFEGLMPVQCDQHYRIPDGRSALILRWALNRYPRKGRYNLSDVFS